MTVDLSDAFARARLVMRLLLTSISTTELSALQDELSRMHAVMPIVDPTGYRALLSTMPDHERAIAALRRCRAELVAITGELLPAGDSDVPLL